MRNLPRQIVRCRAELDADKKRVREALWMWCPGCKDRHRIITWQAPGQTGPVWSWDGNMERPTISPSILCYGSVFLHEDGTQCADWSKDYQTEKHTQGNCHSFVRDGRWEFLSDCAHELAGQTVAMVPLPDAGL